MTNLTDTERHELLSVTYAYAFPADDDDPRREWDALKTHVERIKADAYQQGRADLAAKVKASLAKTEGLGGWLIVAHLRTHALAADSTRGDQP